MRRNVGVEIARGAGNLVPRVLGEDPLVVGDSRRVGARVVAELVVSRIELKGAARHVQGAHHDKGFAKDLPQTLPIMAMSPRG